MDDQLPSLEVKKNFTKIPNEVARCGDDIGNTAFRIYCVLMTFLNTRADRKNHQKFVWPTYDSIRELSGVKSNASVVKALKELEENKLILIVKADYANKSNQYLLLAAKFGEKPNWKIQDRLPAWKAASKEKRDKKSGRSKAEAAVRNLLASERQNDLHGATVSPIGAPKELSPNKTTNETDPTKHKKNETLQEKSEQAQKPVRNYAPSAPPITLWKDLAGREGESLGVMEIPECGSEYDYEYEEGGNCEEPPY